MGWTPLMRASEDDNVEIMKVLLEYKADVNAQTSKGRTALSFAAAPSSFPDGNRRDDAVGALRQLLICKADLTPTKISCTIK